MKVSLSNISTNLTKFSLALVSSISSTIAAESEEYHFDGKQLFGSEYVLDLNKFNEEEQGEGEYFVDIFVNDRLIDSNKKIKFVKLKSSLQACLTNKFWSKINLKESNNQSETELDRCDEPSFIPSGISTEFVLSSLRFKIVIPQALLDIKPRDWNRESWDRGENLAFVNYNTNFFLASHEDSDNVGTGYFNFNNGLNLGDWQIRNRLSFQLQKNKSLTSDDFNLSQTYAGTALPEIDSYLKIGQGYSGGQQFGSLNYIGFNLKSDVRMLPQSQRGYAPTVSGIANGTSKVTIFQHGSAIHQVTVPSGPFSISDLMPTSANGDLHVEVESVDGKKTYFEVPFSAVPTSLRQGLSRYEVSIGRTKDYIVDTFFADLTYEQGINNELTLMGSARLADNYQSLGVGTTISTSIGSFGLEGGLSLSEEKNKKLKGTKFGITYSKFFDFGTHFSLGSYWFTSKNYRELEDTLADFEQLSKQDTNSVNRESFVVGIERLSEKERVTANLSHQLSSGGHFLLNGSLVQYHDSDDTKKQLQFGYSDSVGTVNYSITYMKSFDFGTLDNSLSNEQIYFAMSMPFGSNSGREYNVTSGISTDIDGAVGLSLGMTAYPEDVNDYSYGINATSNYVDSSQEDYQVALNASKQFPLVYVNAGIGITDTSTQANAAIQGGMVLHSGGLNLSKPLGNTFAIVEAKGASGINIGFGEQIGNNGYGIVTSLSPYSSNKIIIAANGSNQNIDFKSNEKEVVPYDGAGVKVRFDTRSGTPVLARFVRQKADEVAPFGADIIDGNNEVVGVIGLQGKGYFLAEQLRGDYVIKWGDSVNETCNVKLDVSKHTKSRVIQTELLCN